MFFYFIIAAVSVLVVFDRKGQFSELILVLQQVQNCHHVFFFGNEV